MANHKPKIGNYVTFVGTFNLTTDFETKAKNMPRVITSERNKNWKGKELSVLVKHDTQSQVIRLFGGIDTSKGIETLSSNKDDKGKSLKLTVPLSKRFDEEVIKNVANFKKVKLPRFKCVKKVDSDVQADIDLIIKVGQECYVVNESPLTVVVGKNKVVGVDENVFSDIYEKQPEFISEYDAIEFIENNLVLFEGKEFKFSGNLKLEAYDGKVMQKFYFQNMYNADEKDTRGFVGNLAMFVTQDSFDTDYVKKGELTELAKTERKLPITVHVAQYKDKENYDYFPVKAVVKIADKFDFENEKHMDKLKFIISSLSVKKKGKVNEIGMGVRYFKGTEDSNITMDDLTDFEKRKIEMGLDTLESLASKKVKSEKVNEVQIKFEFHQDYTEGAIEVDLTEDDLVFIAPEKKEAPKKAETKVEDSEPSDDDLF